LTPPRWPCVVASSAAKDDIIDETLKLFRAQVFFKNFEVRPRARPPVPSGFFAPLHSAVPHVEGVRTGDRF
jgi:hypothetical protein